MGKSCFPVGFPPIPPMQPQGPGLDEGCREPGGTHPHVRMGLGSAPSHGAPAAACTPHRIAQGLPLPENLQGCNARPHQNG